MAAVFAPALRLPAMIAGLVSMLAFGLATGPSGRKVRTTAVVDVGLSAALAVALLLHLVSPSPVG